MDTALAMLMVIQIHSWYDQQCCRDRDCHPVSCDSIHKAIDGGWNWEGIHFNKKQLRMSQDDGCHVCVFPSGTEGICIYLPTNS